MMTDKPYNRIYELDRVSLTLQSEVGTKAATLGTLRQADLSIPDGFCIPGTISEENLPWHEIFAAYQRLVLSGQPVAVRSSGVQEDSATASYAGQYETILNVKTSTALREAIEQCLASARSQRVQRYQQQHGLKNGSRLGVLVQRQLTPAVSGVLFTADPVTGEPTTVIEAVSGLGESLVSGHAAPACYRVSRDGDVQMLTEQTWLNKAQCRALAKLGQEVVNVLGADQDVEWALVEGEFFVLQARPIVSPTLSASPISMWTRANVGEVLPDVVTPLTWAVFRATLQDQPDLVWDVTEAKTDQEGIRRLQGRVYLRLDALLDTFCYLPDVTPAIMQQVLGAPIPRTKRPYTRPEGLSVRSAQVLFWLDALGVVPRLRYLVRRLPSLTSVAEDISELMSWNARCFQLHLKCTAYTIGAYGVIAGLLRRGSAPDADAYLLHLLKSQDAVQTSIQGLTLWRLAANVQESPTLQALFASELDERALADKLQETRAGRTFWNMLQMFLESNGARAVGEFELAQPRWREDPSFVLTILRNYVTAQQVSHKVDRAETKQIEEQMRARIRARLSPMRRHLLDRLVASYGRYVTLRENIKYRLIEGYAALRRLFLQIGTELLDQQVLVDVEDIFFLYPAEIQAFRHGQHSPTGAAGLIAERKRQHDRWSARDVPTLVLDGGQQVDELQADVLNGIGCSPGIAEGKARILHRPADAEQLQPGEILVAENTDPGWTPLFLTSRAIVTEIGGFLSHGATVAREYGVPAVFNVPGATQQIHTGDMLRVDGTRGRVSVISQASESARSAQKSPADGAERG